MKWKKANKKTSGWKAAMESRDRRNPRRRDMEYKHVSPREGLRMVYVQAKIGYPDLYLFLSPLPDPQYFHHLMEDTVRQKIQELRQYPHLPFPADGHPDAQFVKFLALELKRLNSLSQGA